MRPEIVAADRSFAVRRAAASWQRAGAIDPPARQEVDRLWADDRRRTGGWFRLLLFVFTAIAAVGAFGLIGLVLGSLGLPPLAGAAMQLVLAATLAAATELLHGGLRLRRFGVEEATGWLAVGAAAGAVTLAAGEIFGGGGSIALLVGSTVAVLAALAAWRWGLPAAGAAAAGALFVALADLPAGRWWWIAGAPPLAWALERLAESPAAAPAHRWRAREGWWVALAALYVAVHPMGVARGWFAAGRPLDAPPAAGPAAVGLAWAAIVGLPLLLVASGLATRRRTRLDAGLLAAAATVATAVDRLAPRPLWPVLLAAGLLLVALALLLRRRFRRAAGHTWGGWTSDALFDDADRAAALELAGAAAALSPPARELPPERGFEGEGGEFGGGGASGRF